MKLIYIAAGYIVEIFCKFQPKSQTVSNNRFGFRESCHKRFRSGTLLNMRSCIVGLLVLATHLLGAEETKIIQAPNGTIVAEVASSDAQVILGLSNRSGLDAGHGMLFVFKKPSYAFIWMKDMLFPIDVVWLNQKKVVTYIKLNFTPESYRVAKEQIGSPRPDSLYVVELPAGDVERLGITVGSQLFFD